MLEPHGVKRPRSKGGILGLVRWQVNEERNYLADKKKSLARSRDV